MTTSRAPILVPRLQRGLHIPAARHARIAVEDGRLIHVDAEGRRAVLAGPGEITRVVVASYAPDALYPPDVPILRAHGAGTVGLMAGEETRHTLRLLDWTAGDVGGTTLSAHLEVSGVAALARGLDAPLEVVHPDEVPDLRRIGRRDRQSLRPGGTRRLRGWRTGLLLVAALLGLLAVPDLAGVRSTLLVGLAALLAAPPVLLLWSERRRFLRTVATVPDAAGRSHVVDPVLGAGSGALASVRMLVGRDYLVVHGLGQEQWIPGPALGGVARCDRNEAAIHLRDCEGREMLVLDPAVWGRGPGTARPGSLDSALAAVGVRTGGTTPEITQGKRHEFGTTWSGGERHLNRTMDVAETGGGSIAALGTALWVPWWLTILAVPGLGVLVPVGVLAFLLSAGLVAGQLHAWLSLRTWSRRQRSRTDAM